ncbi:MAG TPA: aminotransferase class IV [Candidatus Paceibacterota bacterium]|uniref:Amino acid aminotransferase n=1 Tax=Candidatus Ryanbacteria bacterium RIFCSPHIGHO2_01_FULL_45_22 TaxID=1802114 RepID=A0A1G2G236_9BACT|nr:MAG: hypothetical protein A2719_04390 [Candidatus Ryanbacteria bacterium RIFCSPHIGHO2_01_FULL_45_22]
MRTFCYLNGKILPLEKASVSVYDIGLLRGFAIYEALVTYNRKPFQLDDHLTRFRRSAKSLALKIPDSDSKIRATINELVRRSIPKNKEAIIRFILTGGKAIDGIDYEYEKPTFYILVEDFNELPKKYLENGCSLIMFEQQRQFAESKTTNYIQAVLLQKARKKGGALEILYVSNGKVLEASTSNFFIVKNNTVITAKSGILKGITRKVTIDLAKSHFPLKEREIKVKELYSADEAFITSSFKDVVPVVKIGSRRIGNGKVGPVTKEIMRLFKEYTSNY